MGRQVHNFCRMLHFKFVTSNTNTRILLKSRASTHRPDWPEIRNSPTSDAQVLIVLVYSIPSLNSIVNIKH